MEREMNGSRFLIAVCLLATCAQVAFSSEPDAAQRQRIRRLQESMLAPVLLGRNGRRAS